MNYYRKLSLFRLQQNIPAHKFGTFSAMANDLTTIFLSGVHSVQPRNLLRNAVRIEDRNLVVHNQTFHLDKPCYVVGFGKAVLGMAVELENILGENLAGGVVTIPTGILDTFRNLPDFLPKCNSAIRFIEGAKGNLPDSNAYSGALQIKELASGLNDDDLLVVLISGGGSALLPYPKPPMTLDEKYTLIKELSRRGADIHELNSVRKKVSVLKGGGLANIAQKARIVGLVLSDIVGDPLDFIASGPTVANTDADDAALDIVKKYRLFDQISEHVKQILTAPHNTSLNMANISNFVIGSNTIAANASKAKAECLGYETRILSTKLQDNVENLARFYAELAGLIATSNRSQLKVLPEKLGDIISDDLLTLDFSKKICIIGAGEPTVFVRGGGVGGRSQELALRFSVELNNRNAAKIADISFLSAGTDGMDGPTDAAGAIGSSNLVNKAQVQDINPSQFLDNNDSYNFYARFDAGKQLIKTGHTGTNVMDLHVLIINPASKLKSSYTYEIQE